MAWSDFCFRKILLVETNQTVAPDTWGAIIRVVITTLVGIFDDWLI